jgi:hypothetical protein
MRSSRLGVTALAAAALLAALAACSDQGPTVPSLRAAKGGGGTSDVTVTATDPDSATQDTTLDVVVSGSGFDQGSVAQWAINGVPASKVQTNSTTYVNPKKLVANITIASDADTGYYDVVVTASTGKKGIGSELFAIRTKGVGQQQPNPEIAFNWNGELWVMTATGTKLFQVVDASWVSSFGLGSSWAPGGDGTLANPYHLAFAAAFARGATTWPVAIVDIDTVGGVVNARNHRVLVTSEPAVHFAWSPRGDSIAIADGAPEGSWPSDMHFIAPDGTGEHTVYSAPDSTYVRYPAWSPDGRFVAFVLDPGMAAERGVTYSIQVLDLTTRAVRTVLEFPAGAFVADLDWGRKRNVLAYYYTPSCSTPSRKCPVGLYTAELDASASLIGSPRLLQQGYGVRAPSWTPDDSALLFSDGTVRSYDLATGKVTNLSTGGWPERRR